MNDIQSEAERKAKSIDAQQAADSKTAFFDAIADQWDGFQGDMTVFQKTLAQGLREIGVGESETILDVGCGTGNLTGVLLDHLSAEGRVVAVDISPRMLAEARRKVIDSRVQWIQTDAARLDLPLPRIVSEILVQIVHQTGTLIYETGRIASAMAVRGATGGGKNVYAMLWSLPRVWLPRVIERAERVAMAMELREYRSGVYGFDSPVNRFADVFVLVLMLTWLAAVVVMRYWGLV